MVRAARLCISYFAYNLINAQRSSVNAKAANAHTPIRIKIECVRMFAVCDAQSGVAEFAASPPLNGSKLKLGHAMIFFFLAR